MITLHVKGVFAPKLTRMASPEMLVEIEAVADGAPPAGQ